ncbi:MAG: cytosolic protein, partial [Clostridiales bacterium]|nr:cytosolic protein [Clostridiales bacterium]
IDSIAKNWLAQDGVWFQAVEFTHGMNDAKRCNDSTWVRFSPFEAWSIKRLLGLGDKPGLKGLERALNFRMYGRLNVQSCQWEAENCLIFHMNDCRVQSARVRKGLEDYPCKSAGLVEYSSFAEAIDPRIKTECLGCPPDPHPAQWFCAWKFTL